MTRNPHLEPLSHRLNAHQQSTRREKMHRTGTWRHDMEVETAKTRGIAIQAFQRTQEQVRVMQRRMVVVAAWLNVALLALGGRVFGWW